MKKPTKLKALTFAVASITSAHTIANNNAVDEMVVTATRTPVSISKSLASISTVNREQLEIAQPLDLVDVFRQTPGIDIVRSGGPGSNASFFTRGNASDHTLILVDGQRISSATLGLANLEFLSPDQIERIEIVRGSRSSLYGSDAIGGVIQVFTRDGSNSEGSYLSGTTGSHNQMGTAAGTSAKHGDWHYGLHGSWMETEGIDNLVNDDGFNSDRDGYRNRSLSAALGRQIDENTKVDVHYLLNNARSEHDNSFSPSERPYSDTRMENINVRFVSQLTDRWQTELSAGVAINDSDNYEAEADINTSNFRTTRTQFFWQNNIELTDDHLLSAGFDYYENKVEGSTDYMTPDGDSVSKRDNSAYFVQYQGQFQQLDLVLGLREDDHEEFGSHTTGHVAIGFSINDTYRVIASWSEGFKAPTFNDLYWPAGPFSAGNPDLKPEESENVELSLRAGYEDWHWNLTWFRNDVENLIDWAAGEDWVWRPYNVSSAEIEGGELIIGTQLWNWSVDASYTYVEPRDETSDKLLVRRSRNNLTLNAYRQFDRWSVALAMKTQSDRYADAGNSTAVGGYTLVDAKLAYQLTPELKTTLAIYNALDRDYQLNPGYNQDGRHWQVGVSYNF